MPTCISEPSVIPTADPRRVVHSPWIGAVEWGPDCDLFFPLGLPGFERERRMLPVEIPAQRPLVYLQSLDQPEVCFVCLPVFVVDPGFELSLTADERSALMLEPSSAPVIGGDLLCLGVLVPSGESVEVNLTAPVVIALASRRGLQKAPVETRCAGRKGCFRLEADGRWSPLC